MNSQDQANNDGEISLSPDPPAIASQRQRPSWLRRLPDTPQLQRDAIIANCLSVPLVGSAALYPTRSLVFDDSDESLLQEVVDRKLAELLAQSLPQEVLFVELQDQLCGPEPFTAPELQRFLRSVARAVQCHLEQRVARSRNAALPTSTSGQTTCAIAAPNDVTAKYNVAPGTVPSFDTAEISPETTGCLLRTIREMIDADSADADVFLLYYFAACTEAEIAAILDRPEVDIEKLISLAECHLARPAAHFAVT